MTATPWSARSSSVDTAIASTTTSSIRGQRGRKRRITSSSPSEPAPTASVARLVSGIASIVFHSSSTYEPPEAATPSRACNWSITMPIAKPSTKPARTALERNVDTQPIRSRPSARYTMPVVSASAAV